MPFHRGTTTRRRLPTMTFLSELDDSVVRLKELIQRSDGRARCDSFLRRLARHGLAPRSLNQDLRAKWRYIRELATEVLGHPVEWLNDLTSEDWARVNRHLEAKLEQVEKRK